MHLNTSQVCFEGSGTGKREERHNTLKNLKVTPKKHLGEGRFWGMLAHHPISAGSGASAGEPRGFILYAGVVLESHFACRASSGQALYKQNSRKNIVFFDLNKKRNMQH